MQVSGGDPMATKNYLPESKNFKTICLVSSAAFSAASCVWPWTAPIGATLGLYASINTTDRPKLEEEFTSAVDTALKRTKNSLTTVDSKNIIDELSSDIVRPDNLDDLISETETFRRQYCTTIDKKRIVDIFEMHFREEVCRCDTLSNYYLLAAGTVTLETIKSVNDALTKQDKKLSAIKQGVDKINHNTNQILAILNVLLREGGFILIAVAGCLCLAFALTIQVPFFYIHIIICYSFAALFTSSILRVIPSKASSQKAVPSKAKKRQPENEKVISIPSSKTITQSIMSNLYPDFLFQLVVYTAVSIGIYLLIVASQPSKWSSETIMKQVGCVSIGCMVSCFLKVIFRSKSADVESMNNIL